MTKLLLTLTIFSISINCWSQTKKLVVRIDTIDFIDNHEDFHDFKLMVTNQGFANMGEVFDSAEFHINTFPQYYNTITLRTDSSQLRIPLDKNEGYVEIRDLFHTDVDTLRIDFYRLYSNCNYDSVRTWTTYFLGDTLSVDTTRSNVETVINQMDCLRQPPDNVQLKINDHLYFGLVHFEAEVVEFISTGNGSTRSIFGEEKDRFHSYQTTSYGINVVKINMNQ